jgi:hypothetical protein
MHTLIAEQSIQGIQLTKTRLPPIADLDPIEEETVQLSDNRSWIEYQEFALCGIA